MTDTERPKAQFRSDFTVELVDSMGNDYSILRAMLVASNKDEEAGMGQMPLSAAEGRINALMRERHGTPFEHAAMTFYVEAPIFVFREWHRHRIGVSINEQSGRYSELPGMFYLPPNARPLVKVEGTKQMDYVSEAGTPEQRESLLAAMRESYTFAYDTYLDSLADGIVKEVARMVLPVGVYSKMYWTCNPRSLMAFLSLRVRDETATFPSKPQWEIDACARFMEQAEGMFSSLFPITHTAFVKHGRVAP